MDTPFFEQKTEYTCGPASMKMVLDSLGIKRTEKQLIRLLRTNKVRGTWLKYFPRLAEKYGLDYVVKRNASIRDVRRLLRKGYGIIICYSPGRTEDYTVDHYSVVRRVDSKNIYLLDPWDGPKTTYSIQYFESIWRCDPKHEDDKKWLFAVKK